MQAVLINPADRTVTAIQTDGKLKSLQDLVQGRITGIYPGNFIEELAGVHGYVDDEGLYAKSVQEHGAFAIGPYEPLIGPAVLLGSTRSGGEADCPVTAEQVARHVRWMVARF